MERDALGDWTMRARFVIESWCRRGFDFTSDDLRRVVGEPPGLGNILGALLAAEVRASRIEECGRRKSSRPDRHGARIGVYRGRA
jgi:hypothetical protein